LSIFATEQQGVVAHCSDFT